jgi:hypothetical protein
MKQSLDFQDSKLSKSAYEDLFNQIDLDYEQNQEALFITDTADLIAFDNEQTF